MTELEMFKEIAKTIAFCEEKAGRKGRCLVDVSMNSALHTLKLKGFKKPCKTEKRIVREYLADFFAIYPTAADRLIEERRNKVGYDVPFYEINPLKA